MSADSGQGDLYSTPCRAQKCLFGPDDSSSKNNVFRNQNRMKGENELSSEESDLGPMSPLSFTDQSPSSRSSSSGRQYVSPCVSPEKMASPSNLKSWDRLYVTKKHAFDDHTFPFSVLKQITNAARHTPKRRIFPTLPTYLPDSLEENKFQSTTNYDLSQNLQQIIPETPSKNVDNKLTETPHKIHISEHNLITPLGSVTKVSSLPRLHRQKSDKNNCSSPKKRENNLKRHGSDIIETVASKLVKIDDNCTISKARAALFQENKQETKLKNFTFSTSKFYNNKVKRIKSVSNIRNYNDQSYKTRRSLPVQHTNRRSLKLKKLSGINGGVSHGIKRPKRKVNTEKTKKDECDITQNSIDLSDKIQNQSFSPEQSKIRHIEQVQSPEIDYTKRFFKTNRTVKQYNEASVTVSSNVKLKVVNGTFTLNQKGNSLLKNNHKRQKLSDISFDTTDLTVEEPQIEASIEQSNIKNILKILEEDWANDEFDTMQPLTTSGSRNEISPKSITFVNDVTMSPGSELSNMTSTMNIKDVAASANSKNIPFHNTESNDIVSQSEEKTNVTYYPLFAKGYVANNIYKNDNVVSTRGMKRTANWQLSIRNDKKDQYQLDAGQIRFGATQCTECNVVYQIGDPEDENAHLNYHNSVKTLRFQGWKSERVVAEDPITSSRIILIEPTDPKQCWKKVSDILGVVDNDLGLSDMKLSNYYDKKVYLYVREKSVLGVLVAENIKTAYRMIPELIDLDCCTAESTPAKCGINVVWTAMKYRRQGIATKLVNILRSKFYYGYIMSVDDIAFSIPTQSGKKFAEKYTNTKKFKVYS